MDYLADESLQSRIAELAEKANEDELTVEERKEYEWYAQANQSEAILRALARRRSL